MTHAYSDMYLEDAMRTLGEAVDFALCDQGLSPVELTNPIEFSRDEAIRAWCGARCLRHVG